jgi:E3 ubiquitin-protein ligase HUWE1
VADAIVKLLNTTNEELPEVLAKIDVWKWPRSDLNVWVKVLNKFDAILEEVIKEYEIDKLQLKVFTPFTKRTVCEILRFERLLLENSTNRKMFNSYDVIIVAPP